MRKNNNGNSYMFSDEHLSELTETSPWKILILCQEKYTHDLVKSSLQNVVFEQQPLLCLNAYTFDEAMKILKQNPDIAVAILHISQDQDKIIKKFVNYARKTLHYDLIRLILLFDNLEFFLIKKIITEHDINDFKVKAQFTSDSIYVTVVIALRAFRQLLLLKSCYQSLKIVADSAERFVPRNFLKLLNKNDIAKIQLTDHVENQMTVLFLDVRSFTELSEFLSPLECFEFINEYVSYLEPGITKNSGFIDKYIGDAIMALFPDNPDDAIKAAIHMLVSLRDYNFQRFVKYQRPIRIGIGINTGSVVIGAIGYYDRLECTVVSDAVNVASRIEKLNKIFGTHLLISENSFLTLKNPNQFHYRSLGAIKILGKRQEISIYEIFDMDSTESVAIKEQTKLEFNQAISLYQAGDMLIANRIFKKIFNLNRHDLPAKFFVKKTNRYLKP
jgi:two-component system sensor histidine kinase ChiS